MKRVRLLKHNKEKKAPLSKISLLVQIVGEIQAALCSNDSTYILLKQA